MTTSRGPCPPARAAEVYALTLARTRRRCRAASPHQQTIPDVVGEAFVRWLARGDNKTEHEAGEHAHHLTLTVMHYLTCPRTRRRAANDARPIADLRTSLPDSDLDPTAGFETLLRVTRGGSEAPADAEGDVIERLDAARRYLLGRPTTTALEALAVLADRGWSVPQVAAGAGCSENSVHNWTRGLRRPTAASTATLVRLAATDGPPPAPHVRPLPRHASAAAPPTHSPDEVRDALASLLCIHTHRSLAAAVGVTRQAVTMWATGRREPGPIHRRRLRLALTKASPATVAVSLDFHRG